MPTKKKAPPKRKPRWTENEVIEQPLEAARRKTRYSQADVDTMLREQYESMKKEPNLHDNLEAAKQQLAAWDKEIESRQRDLDCVCDLQADAKRAVQAAAAALVAAAKEAQRNL